MAAPVWYLIHKATLNVALGRVLIGNYLADLATKLFASETAGQIGIDAIRIHGGYGYPTEFDVEHYFRGAPLPIAGKGTNEIRCNIIVRKLVSRGTVAP